MTCQRLAAYALIVDEAGRVLLTQQVYGRGRLGRWILPGGGVEHGEHPEQAVVRETCEETGLPVRTGELLQVVSDVTTVGRRRRAQHNVRMIYRATIVPAGAPSDASADALAEARADAPAGTPAGALAGALAEPGPPDSPPPLHSPARRLSEHARWCAPQEWRTLPMAPFVIGVLDANSV